MAAARNKTIGLLAGLVLAMASGSAVWGADHPRIEAPSETRKDEVRPASSEGPRESGRTETAKSREVSRSDTAARADARRNTRSDHGSEAGERTGAEARLGGARDAGNPHAESRRVEADAKERQIWTPREKPEKLSSVENAYQHWDDHKKEFPEYNNSKQYVEGAWRFVDHPPKGTMSFTRARDNSTAFYDPTSNTFAVKDVSGAPRTYMRPPEGRQYYDQDVKADQKYREEQKNKSKL